MASTVQVRNVLRRFPGAERAAVSDVSLDVAAGEVVSLVGPSGSGKSTLLRMLAGLEFPDSGDICIDEKSVLSVPPQERDVAMVFQGFALYPHMTVAQNLGFPLKMRGVTRSEREKTVHETAELLSIAHLLQRRPAQLSGGEQQRVAMGRAIVRKPRVFLFDEPLSNLDAALRAELRVELKKLLKRLGTTALYVTHDQTEAMTLSGRICVLNHGSVEQIDPPKRIYQAPRSAFVAGFFGLPPMNLLAVERVGENIVLAECSIAAPKAKSSQLWLGFRPEHVVIERDSDEQAASAELRVRGRLSLVEPLGAETHLELDLAGSAVKATLPGLQSPEVGSEVLLCVRAEHLLWFDRETGKAL